MRMGTTRQIAQFIYETDLEKIRFKMKNLGLKTDSVREAIKWARSK